MTIRADDGTPLEPKEGAILDKEGNTLLETVPGFRNGGSDQEKGRSAYQTTKIFKFSPWMAPLLAVGLLVAFALGTVVLGVVLSLLLSVWLLRSIFRALGF
jgi:hypothetical protein